MNVQGYIRVPLARQGEDGEDAAAVYPSADVILFEDGEYEKEITIVAYKGSQQLYLASGDIHLLSLPSAYSIYTSSSGGVATIRITRPSLSITTANTLEYEVNVGNNIYIPQTLGINWATKGEQGANGDPGEDAIMYELELSTDSIHYNAAAGAATPNTISAGVRRVEGETRTWVPFRYTYILTIESGETLEGSGDALSYAMIFNGLSYYCNVGMVSLEVTFYPTENEAAVLTKTFYTTTSYMPRTQIWENCADDFPFCQGQIGEQFIDFVWHNDALYQCRQSHTKNSDATPMGGNNDPYWIGVNKFDNVATGVLLADTAKIDNLYVDDVYMEGVNTAIWINPNQDGIKINDVARLENEGRDSSTWSNPTAYFHGTAIPDPSQVYSGSGSSSPNISIATSGTIRDNSGGTTRDIGYNSVQLLASVASLSVTPNAQIAITFGGRNTTPYFSFTEGDDTPYTGNRGDESAWTIELRMSTSSSGLTTSGGYTTLWKNTFSGGNGQGGETYTYNFSQLEFYDIPTESTYYFGVYLVDWNLRCGASLSLSSDIYILSTRAITENYISQYGANGLFIGQKSDTFFRAKVAKDSGSAYDMLAEGYGVAISNAGSLQHVAGNTMPLGGLLLNAFFNPNSSTGFLDVNIWTFDGSSVQVTYVEGGHYRIALPYAWAYIFGGYYQVRSGVHLTLHQQGTAHVSQESGDGSTIWGYIDIYTYNTSGTQSSRSVYMSFFYVSHSNAASLSQNTTQIIGLSAAAEKSSAQETEILSETDKSE